MKQLTDLLSTRCQSLDTSGIRKIFEMATTLTDPINLSIGQPHFDVPEPVKQAAIDAIQAGHNGYTRTQGIGQLHEVIAARLKKELDWDLDRDGLGVLVTSGTSGGLILSFMTFTEAGDEAIIPDPYFVIYPAGCSMSGAQAVYCDTYPDFRMTAERLEPLITERTKFVLLNSPGNPTGIVLTSEELHDIVDLCNDRGVLLISDEIYDEFTYPDGREDGHFPTPAQFTRDMLLLRGFSKSYGMTGWRMGYAVGPRDIVNAMAKMQQYSFVCAPSMVQWAGITALNTDITSFVAEYDSKRRMVLDAFKGVAEIVEPKGAFYAFVKVPEHLGMTGTEFVKSAIERNVLVIPGSAFSRRDTHIRISYATTDEKLREGLDVLVNLMKRGT
ncbi:MAG: aminotransferase class I/II-fold pyridoxal phosphate-dependent enzyme [Planctomycetes bacterium]|nr:aminotransferase class I/II-fold pyridoxal phosphate-dependent enzyme [Planctomycetota bacterium]NOG54336.1 aminotransferase class I/II-fold pyridoxal phosphate-dependent enzyme [Planctomycetota bacterium]